MKTPEILLEKVKELEAYYSRYYPHLAPLVGPCFLSTIETTVRRTKDDYFVITGDIPAMWLRDSTAQIMHYVRYAAADDSLRSIIEGVIHRQARMVLIDPYANAFNETPDGSCFSKDETETDPWVWEKKYEVDSLCAPVYLLYSYWKATGSTDIFDREIKSMLEAIYTVFTREQNHGESEYAFVRRDCKETDTLPCEGKGNPVGITGMTWSGFRPSDDRCVYGYLIPAQMMAVKALEYASEILRTIYEDEESAARYLRLRGEIQSGVERFGIVEHEKYGRIYAYEADGMGRYICMDDANCPSLLALPYLDYCDKADTLYRNTRSFILSEENPYYYSGRFFKGVGSQHTPEGSVWPIAVIMQAMTSQDTGEILACLDMLADSHAGTNHMHESVNADNPHDFTRSWFAWADSLFAELLIRLKEQDFFGSF